MGSFCVIKLVVLIKIILHFLDSLLELDPALNSEMLIK